MMLTSYTANFVMLIFYLHTQNTPEINLQSQIILLLPLKWYLMVFYFTLYLMLAFRGHMILTPHLVSATRPGVATPHLRPLF